MCATLTRGGMLALALVAVLAAGVQPRPPHVLVILTDDQGYADASAWGGTDVRTPHLDALARAGMLFTGMRANGTVCSPTRAALLTGRDADRAGVPGVIRTNPNDSWGRLAPDVPMLPALLQQAGYHTAIVGKWHLGLAPPDTPEARGFQLVRAFLGDMMDSYTTHRRHGQNYLRHGTTPVEADGHATDVFTAWAIEYLRARAATPDQPFFLYLAYNAPHFPIEPPEPWLARVRARAPSMSDVRAKAVAFDEHTDAAIGQVLAALDETGLARDTLVVFTSDNGGSQPHGQRNDPWRGGKQQHYDGGLRVPFAVRWPGQIPPAQRTDYAGQVFDAYATILEAAGVPAPPGMDAVSVLPLLRGEPMEAGERTMYFVRREGGPAYGGLAYHAIVRGPWKLLRNSPYEPLELYHLERDPGEQDDLAAREPEVRRALQTELQRRIQRGGATPWQ